MSAVPELVTLIVDGQALQGWQSVRVQRSVEAAVISFDLGASNPAWSSDAKILRNSSRVEIQTRPDGELGPGAFAFSLGDPLCTGFVDVYDSQTGPGANRAVSISGRSAAADACDCEPVKHKTGYVKDKDLIGVAKEFDEWGLDFRSDQSLDKIPKVQRVPGEPLFATLERETRRLGLFLMGEPDGSVNITKGASGQAAGALVEGQLPLKSFRLVDEMRLAYSEAIVRGQQAIGTDEKELRQEQRATNGGFGSRYRPYLLFNEGSNSDGELKKRAAWELTRRNGARLQVHANVAAWRDAGGQLWAPRTLVPVMLPSEDLSLALAIHTVVFNQVMGEGEGTGTWADLTLVHPEHLGSSS